MGQIKRDLIERLREQPTERESKRGIDAETTRIWNDLFLEAAAELELLQARDRMLSALEGCGVDNWDGWDDSVAAFEEEEREAKTNA